MNRYRNVKFGNLILAGILGWSVSTASGENFSKPDLTVAADGSGDFKTIQAAVASIPDTNRERIVIFIKDGLYHEKIRVDASFVTLRGQSRTGTRIEFPQGADEFTQKPDKIGRAVVNINGDDFVLENLTVKNTHGVIGPHAFAIYGQGDRTVITDCDVLSDGADTLALWSHADGRSYQARLNLRGSVDFICPRGWSYMTDCNIYQVNPAANAAIWHDGSKNADMKFVLRDCKFDGTNSWILARHHHDAQFFLLDCTFSKTMRDLPPKRVIYPLGGSTPTEADIQKNRGLDASNIWGERAYFYNCHRDGGDYGWFTNNLSTATNAPAPEQITAAWTFGGKWNPENTSSPAIKQIKADAGQIAVTFSENVTVKGKPRLVLSNGGPADFISGSGSATLIFENVGASNKPGQAVSINLNDGAIIACEAGATLRLADVSLPNGAK
jgi:pectinesterase